MLTATFPDFTRLPDGAIAFPEAAEVFVVDQQELARHLQPLLSIDASSVNPQWSGRLHLLSPVEPYEGLVGELTENMGFDGELLKTNWIGFLLENGRYRLCGDPRYFFLHADNKDLPEAHPGMRDELQQHYTTEHAAYQEARQSYRERGYLTWPQYDDDKRFTFFDVLGGDAQGFANWVETVKFPMDIIKADDNSGDYSVWPLSPAKRRFHHVLSVPASHYGVSGADLIVMFYEPVEGLVLFTYDWT